MKIYIVTGEAGDYDDYQEWNVAVYLSEELAEEHRQKAQYYSDSYIGQFLDYRNPWDPDMYHQDDTEYRIQELEVMEEVPE